MVSEDKQKLAETIRSSNFIEPVFDRSYLEWLKLVEIEENSVETSEGPCRIYLHRAKKMSENPPVFINIHGGGFVRPHKPCNTYFTARMTAGLGGIGIDIDYRLAPEYPYPAAFNECYAVTRWVFSQLEEWNSSPELVTMCGHSAGASLVLSVNLKANLTKEFRPALQILDFGAFDMVTDPANKKGAGTNVISTERMRAFNLLYTDNDPKVLYSPYVSASMAPDEMLLGLPYTLIITAGNDNLRFEAEELGQRMIAQNVKVTMERFTDSNHGFTVHCTGKWQEAHALILNTVRANMVS